MMNRRAAQIKTLLIALLLLAALAGVGAPGRQAIAATGDDQQEPPGPDGTFFYKFQREWINDDARLRLSVKGRQVGISWATSAVIAFDVMDPNARGDWVVLSASERQSKAFARTFVKWVKAIDKSLSAIVHARDGKPWTESEQRCDSIAEKVTVLEVVFRNGKIVTFLPANPDTARGWAANVVLDEFAFHRDGREILKGVGPSIARGFQMLIISTPNGKQGQFYELVTAAKNGGNKYSLHETTTSEAIRQGAEIDYQVLCDLLNNDPDSIAQELECSFLDTTSQFISPELLAFAETDKAAQPIRFAGWAGAADDRVGRLVSDDQRAPRAVGDLFADDFARIQAIASGLAGRLFLGLDVGRDRDLTVLTVGAEIDSEYIKAIVPVAIIELSRVSFDSQWAVVDLLLGRCARACIDARGIGQQIAETAQRHHGPKVEALKTTNAINEELANRVLRKLRDTSAKLPAAQAIRASFRSIRKITTTAGNHRFDAERTTDGGHADHFWSFAYMLNAADKPSPRFGYRSGGKRRSANMTGQQRRDERRPVHNDGVKPSRTRGF